MLILVFIKVYGNAWIVEEMTPGGGGGGTLSFSSYVGSGTASTLRPKKISGISSPPKIFEILTTPPKYPHSVPWP